MPKITLEEWAKKYGPLTLKRVIECKQSVRIIFEGKDSTLWDIVIGVYNDDFCIAGECYSLLVTDRIHRCVKIRGARPMVKPNRDDELSHRRADAMTKAVDADLYL